jgi:translocation and assembly module TamB
VLENTRADFSQTKPSQITEAVDDQTPDSTSLDLNLDEVSLKNVHLNYKQLVEGKYIRLDVGETFVDANRIDLKKQLFDLDELLLENTFISYQQYKPKNEKPTSVAKTASSSTHTSVSSHSAKPLAEKSTKPWIVRLDKFSMD